MEGVLEVKPVRGLLFVTMLLLGAWHATAQAPELKVSGYGPLGNLKLKRLLNLLITDKTNQFFSAGMIEDCAVVILSELQQDGYLRPEIVAQLTLDDGQRKAWRWQGALGDPLPSPWLIRQAHFRIHERVRYHYRNIHFEGLQAIEPEEALGYFVDTRGLLQLNAHRTYTPDRAQSSARSLEEMLHREGYQNATVTLTNLLQNDDTGEVDVSVVVEQGRRFVVQSVRVEELSDSSTNLLRTFTLATNQPYSRLWLQDFEQRLVHHRYQQGYPDASADITVHGSNVLETVRLDLLAQVRPGPGVFAGDIRFLGHRETKPSAMLARVPLRSGDLLDRTAAERGRFNLARLGVFESVELRYDVADDQRRHVIYEVEEGREYEIMLLGGFGSYELLRGGVILEKHNVWGLAHDARLKLVQSFKSSSGDFTYTVPQFRWGSDLFFTASGLRRDEVDFTREELSSGIGARRRFQPIATDASLRYSYQYVNAAHAPFVSGVGLQDARIAATILDLRHDRRDNPIIPRTGYKLFGNFEIASSALGGEVNYERIEVHGSYHWPVGKDRWIHFGAAHGAVFAVGASTRDLPFNKRFFPGGENSIRGYREGEASPLDAAGRIIGAESYVGANLEFEQALTPQWSVVGFFDFMGVARDVTDYPVDELLYSAGGGLRWNTLIGPVRLEYGHNLKRRRHDPAGTLHISIGFPF